MKKFILVILIGMIFSLFSLFATEQEPDWIEFDGKELALHTGWGHPSPMQTYFSQREIDYPFQGMSTANYRGHIAHWKIRKGKLFLKEVVAHKGKKPKEYGIKSNGDSVNYKSFVFADWFSGIIDCVEENPENRWAEPIANYVILVRHGNIIDYQRYTVKDKEEMQKLYEAGELESSTDMSMEKKVELAKTSSKYASFYFKMNTYDSLTFKGKSARFVSDKEIPYFLEPYKSDFLKWKYNWENDTSGVPTVVWEIRKKKIYLKDVRLAVGLGLFKTNFIDIDISEVLPEYSGQDEIFGDWVNGDFMIQIGKEVENEYYPGMTKFEAEEVIFVSIENGKIRKKYEFDIDQEINWRDLPSDWSPEMRDMIEKFSSHLYSIMSRY